MLRTTLLLVFIALFFVATHQQLNEFPAGMTTTITQTGLTYAKNVGIKIATAVLNNMTFPDQAGNKDTLRYIVAGIKLQNIILPEASITLQNGSQVFIQFLNVAGQVTAAWWAREDIWPNPKGVGTFTATWIGVTLNLLLDFGTANGKPTVVTPYALCHINAFNLHITGHGLLEEIAVLLKSFR